MKFWKIAFVMLAAFSIASCSSDDRQCGEAANEHTKGNIRAEYIRRISW